MRRLWAILGMSVVLACALGGAPPAQALGLPPPPPPAVPARIDPFLTAALAAAGPADRLVAVAVLDRLPVSLDVLALRATGATAVPYGRLPMVALQGTRSQLTAVATVAHIRSLWSNRPLEQSLHESVALIGADRVAADLGVTGRGVGVAVLDSGIDGYHPDLHYPEHTIQNVKLVGYQKVFEDLVLTFEDVQNTDTTTGHGTHVAGIIAGTGAASGGYYAGVAPGADLIGLGAADGTDMLTALAGYDWILAHRAEYHIRVVNNSWADGEIAYDPANPLNLASKAAHDDGITIVFAAGNGGQTGGNTYNRYAWPDWVIGVAGGTKLGTIGDYSSRGDADHHPDVTAPGSFIASARAITGVVTDANSSPLDLTDPANPRIIAPEHTPYYTAAIGTSMAAPHVAGVVALMLEANPDLTPDEVKQLLVATASPMPGCAPMDCGAGYVNAYAAVQGALAAVNRAPVAVLSATPASGAAPLTATLSAAGSTDVDGTVASYRWDVDGDGAVDQTTTSPTVVHTYPSGVFHPTVQVVDDDGAASTPAGTEVRSSDAPDASAAVARNGKSGSAVRFDASASSDPDGTIASYRFVFGDGTEVTTTSPIVDHVYIATRPTTFAWAVIVTDDAGVSDAVSGSIKITP